VAELSKLLENIFRCVNIAMVNEMKMLCDRMNIDVWEVIQAASTKPFGYTQMPYYVVQRTMEALNKHKKTLNGAKVLCLGAAYKKDIDDMRESPSLRVISLMKEKGAEVCYHDPYVPKLEKGHGFNYEMASVPLCPETLDQYDAVLILTDHSCIDYAMVTQKSQCVIDTRNATKLVGPGREKVTKA
jgi:UDP-N-acetyl-D-glucosamine dehydrogenase